MPPATPSRPKARTDERAVANSVAVARGLRTFLAAAVACLLGWPPGSAWAQTADPVRTGTTQVGTPAPSSAPNSPEARPVARSGGPEDAPGFGANRPKLPEPPANFNTYDVGWVRFAYPPSERQWVEPLIRHADHVRAELRDQLGYPVLPDLRVYLARTPGELLALAPEGAVVPKYATGMAYAELGLVLLALNPLYPNDHHDLVELFRHEAAHVALHQAAHMAEIPRWFDEGFAVHASGESSLLRLRELSTATLSDRLIPLEQLSAGFPSDPVRAELAYAESADIVRFLLRRQDHSRFAALLERVRAGQTFDRALEDAYNTTRDTLELEWQKDVARRYTFWPVLMGGGLVWIGALGLFVWGWRRRKARDRVTLARWAREEAAEDGARQLSAPPAPVRVHVVLARPPMRPPDGNPPLSEVDVPKVQHEGQWHTLH
jgi:hypothetical protein